VSVPFLDTNIFLRHLLNDHEDHSPRSTAYLERVERGEFRVQTADTVVFEVVFTLQSFYRQPKDLIRDLVLPLIELPGIELPGKPLFRRAFSYYVDQNLPFADAYHAALMERAGIAEVVSFDRHFDRVGGIQRIEP
jgi:uncharacterized protein